MRITICGLMLVCCAAFGAEREIPWDLAALSKAPAMSEAAGFSEPGVKAIFYDGMPWQGKPTRVFAWYAIPDVAPGEKVPGMVLVHGGGGTAFANWVRLWSERGYAAIAMDTCGCVPKGEYGKWERHGDGGPAGWGGFESVDDPVKDQWTYHAVADAILAHSLLLSMPGVDPERTGLTGISWGGYLTCITSGVDSRFKCAAPVYGCGFLRDNSAWLDGFKSMGEEKTTRWSGLWDPSVYLPNTAVPMLWITGTNDFAYPMDSLQKSYRLPKGPRQLSLIVRMPHGHGVAGENPEEIHVFCDSVLKGGVPLPKVTEQGRAGFDVFAKYEAGQAVTKAEINYTKDTGKWQDRKWETIPANIDADARRVSGVLPADTAVWYINVYDGRDVVSSSQHEVIKE
jgi:dienelactone hydrolase